MKNKKLTLSALIPLVSSMLFYVFSLLIYIPFVLWKNEPEWLAWTIGLLSALCFHLFAPVIAVAGNTVSIAFQAKALKHREKPWLSILLIILSSIIIIGSISHCTYAFIIV